MASGCQLLESNNEKIHSITFQETIEINYKEENVNSCKFVVNVDGTNIKKSSIDTKKSKIYVSNYEVSCGKVSTNKMGETEITYEIEGQEYTVKALIKDLEKPTISLKIETIEIEAGSDIKFQDYVEYSDNVDGNKDLLFSVDGDFDKNKVGTYEVKLSISDKAKNKSTVTLKVVVKEKPKQQESENDNLQPINSQNNSNQSGSNDNQNQTKPAPYSEYFLFSDGYNMLSAPSACQSKLMEVYSNSRNGTCTTLTDANGNPLGQVLKVE